MCTTINTYDIYLRFHYTIWLFMTSFGYHIGEKTEAICDRIWVVVPRYDHTISLNNITAYKAALQTCYSYKVTGADLLVPSIGVPKYYYYTPKNVI